MAFTSGNDFNILQGSDTAFVGAGAGDDTYIVTPTLLTAGQEVTVSDVLGTNTLQLIEGLTIASSAVASNALQLTLSNGAIITVLGADTFNFNVGGNAVTGVLGVDKDFETFADENLGVTVPADGESPTTGGEVSIGDEAPIEETDVSVDIGSLQTPGVLDAGSDSFKFTDDADVFNNVEISNFTSNDVIEVSNASAGDYSFANDGADVDIIY